MAKSVEINMAVITYYVHSAKTWISKCEGKNQLATDCIKQARQELDTLSDIIDLIIQDESLFEETLSLEEDDDKPIPNKDLN